MQVCILFNFFFPIHLGESSCGIPLSKIASTLKSFEKYKDVHRNRIREGLEYLMNNGDIYETRQEYYRTI